MFKFKFAFKLKFSRVMVLVVVEAESDGLGFSGLWNDLGVGRLKVPSGAGGEPWPLLAIFIVLELDLPS